MKSKLNSQKQEILFWIILFGIPIVFLILLESGLRIFDYGDDLSLFKQATGDKSDYMYLNRWVAKRYFSNQGIPDPTSDVFLKDKPENGYRIFVLGGSTAAGWPYSNNIMFSRILQKRLSDTYPKKNIEVVNTSISAVNSYTFLDFTDEILEYEPDLILIYAGHNEYYGAFGVASTQTIGNFRWLKNFYLHMVHLKTFQLVKNFYHSVLSLFDSETDVEKELSAPLMERLVGEQSIEYGSDFYQQGLIQYKENLSGILDKTISYGVPVIISELVSNIKDQAPFNSIGNSLSRSASAIYDQSKNFVKVGKFNEAKQHYYLAKDLDALRFRASEDFNEVIRNTEIPNEIYVIPMKNLFEQRSENQFIGNKLMLDHLHPNIDGHFIMADAFYQEIINNNLIAEIKDDGSYKTSDQYRKDWGYSILDRTYARMKIKYLKSGWPFIKDERSKVSQKVPDGTIEKIAFRIWKDRSYTSEDGHADLAAYFESKGEFENAFHEYNALSCLKPLNSTAYLKAADVSIKAGNMKRALPFLQYSLKLEETAFAYKWIGLVHLEDNNNEEAIRNLEIVYNLEIKDVELFYNLGLAYFQTGKYDKMKTMLSDLKNMNMNDAQVKWMINTIEKLVQNAEEK